MLPPVDSPAEAEARAAELDQRLDALVAEVRNEDAATLRRRATQYPTRRIFAAGLRHGALLLAKKAMGKDTPGEAPAVSPDLHDAVSRALSTVQGTAHHLAPDTLRLLAERVTGAVAPLVPYREVWDPSLPPGGRVCGICGQPVESEPCPEHAPVEEVAR